MSMFNVVYFRTKQNGPVQKALIRITGVSSEGTHHPEIVELTIGGRSYRGYSKSFSRCRRQNEGELVAARTGDAFHVQMAEIITVYLDSECVEPFSLISLDTAGKMGNLVLFKEMRDELYERLCSGEIQSSSWIEAWMRIQKRKKTETGIWDVRADNLFEIVCALRFAPTIASLWCGLHRYSLTGFMDSYLRMVLFDLLLRQKDRTASNYGLIINSESRTACLSPLFDNGTLDKPYMAENEMALNGLIFCADCLPEAIYQMCGNSVRSVMEEFLQYGTAADLPCQNQIKHRILTGLEIIRDGLKEYTAKWTV